METLVLSHIPSLRAIRAARRAYGRLPWDAVGRVEQRQALKGCVPNVDQLDYDELARMGAWEHGEGEPLHVLVADPKARRNKELLTCHVVSGALPTAALMRMAPGVYACSPAFAALLYSRGRSLGEVLTLLMEFLGTYSLPPRGNVANCLGRDMARRAVKERRGAGALSMRSRAVDGRAACVIALGKE